MKINENEDIDLKFYRLSTLHAPRYIVSNSNKTYCLFIIYLEIYVCNMNPLTNVKNIKKLTEQELQSNNKTSWHDQYKDSAWIFIGGLPYTLTEGDVIAIFSQYGEVVNINLIRDKATGKQKGYGFLCYEDQRSTVLAVDNFNGIKILGRVIRVDHVTNYKAPKESKNIDEETNKLRKEGCAPKKD